MSLAAAAIQMWSEPGARDANLARADELLRQARQAGAQLVVLPELFNTGYCSRADYVPLAEDADGPTLRLLRERSRAWRMGIGAGIVERSGRHLYNTLVFVGPDGEESIYRKRNLVFWEPMRFKPGRRPVIVNTPWGRVGFAVCADMIYRRIWQEYRGQIDLAVISSAWPDFANRKTGRPHWMYGPLGPLCGELPKRIAEDLDVPVVFANQCGETLTKVPFHPAIQDRFAGRSSICDGRGSLPLRAESDEVIVMGQIRPRTAQGVSTCRFTFPSVLAASSSGLVR